MRGHGDEELVLFARRQIHVPPQQCQTRGMAAPRSVSTSDEIVPQAPGRSAATSRATSTPFQALAPASPAASGKRRAGPVEPRRGIRRDEDERCERGCATAGGAPRP